MMCNILVADDEEFIRDLIRQALLRNGYSVTTAASGEEAIQKYNGGHFDLVITDVCMPGIGGMGVLKHIRRSDRHDTPAIGISGTPWLLENTGFDAVLPKPFPLKALFDTMEQFTGGRRKCAASA